MGTRQETLHLDAGVLRPRKVAAIVRQGRRNMEPISTVVGPILKAAAAIDKLYVKLNDLALELKHLAQEDVRYYTTYIEVAAEAIKGIQNEYLEILKQAAQCKIEKEEERDRLRARIIEYIHGEVLRPKLKNAIERLREGRKALEEHAERRLIFPGTKAKRANALVHFDFLLSELEGKLGRLGDYTGPSADALHDIEAIKYDLEKKPFDQVSFDDRIESLLLHLDKSTLVSIAADCGRVIEALRIAFR
jgi:hypothetical protein